MSVHNYSRFDRFCSTDPGAHRVTEQSPNIRFLQKVGDKSDVYCPASEMCLVDSPVESLLHLRVCLLSYRSLKVYVLSRISHLDVLLFNVLWGNKKKNVNLGSGSSLASAVISSWSELG